MAPFSPFFFNWLQVMVRQEELPVVQAWFRFTFLFLSGLPPMWPAANIQSSLTRHEGPFRRRSVSLVKASLVGILNQRMCAKLWRHGAASLHI